MLAIMPILPVCEKSNDINHTVFCQIEQEIHSIRFSSNVVL